MSRMKAWIAGTVAVAMVVAVPLLAQQAPDRSKPPAPGAPSALTLPPIQKHTLANGLPVWIVNMPKVPVAQVNLIVRAGAAVDPAGKYGLASFTAAMLDEGAGTRNALELADAIEFLGINISTGSSWDASTVGLFTPVSKLDDALPLMADVALHPAFSEAEVERLRKERLTTLLTAEGQCLFAGHAGFRPTGVRSPSPLRHWCHGQQCVQRRNDGVGNPQLPHAVLPAAERPPARGW
jgi:zinc protease